MKYQIGQRFKTRDGCVRQIIEAIDQSIGDCVYRLQGLDSNNEFSGSPYRYLESDLDELIKDIDQTSIKKDEFNVGDSVKYFSTLSKDFYQGVIIGRCGDEYMIKLPTGNLEWVDWYNITKPASEYIEKAKQQLPPGTEGKTDLNTKPHMAYIDPYLLREAAIGMRYGANKHGFNNYRKMTDEAAQQVLDSLLRHLNDYLTGKQFDTEQKISNLACALNNLNFLYRIDRLYGYDEVLDNIYGESR